MDFDTVYRIYFNDVFLYLRGLSANPDIAEEITQETFFRALKEINNFRGSCSVKSWLCQIAKNLYISQMRKKNPISCDDEEFLFNVAAKTNIEEEYIQREGALEIYRLVQKIEEPYKEVFLLRTLSDLSFKEISEIFGKTESWARVTYYRAKQKIIERMKENE